VTQNVEVAIKTAKAGQVEYRPDSNGIVHSGLGKLSFTNEALLDNVKAFVQAVVKAKPAGVKGAYIKNVTLSSTMGVGLKLDLNEVLAL
jgi:large subunit ribosomal protein L1